MIHYWQPLHLLRETPTQFYVSPNGSDWNTGNSKSVPLKTIQTAVDLAKPGDQIILLPGRYRERVHIRNSGTKEQPIHLQAETDGTVTIDWKNNRLLSQRTNWKSEGDQVYSIKTPYPIYRVSHHDETLFRLSWGTVDSLKTLIKKQHSFSAFIYLEGRCYVYLKGGLDPSDENLTTHQTVPNPREWGEFRSSNLWIEADNIVIQGINFEYGIGSSVRIWNGENIAIEQCAFSGATYGVQASRGLKPARNLTLDHCLYHNYPQYEWSVEWIDWNQIYAYYDASSLIASQHEGTVVQNCVAVHCGDGLKLSCNRQSTIKVIAKQNWIGNCTDDAIEFDGSAKNVFVIDNVIADSFISLGLSPVSDGPVVIADNLFLHPLPNQEGALFKLLSPKLKPIQNIAVEKNFFWGNWLCWWNDSPVKNLTLSHNTICTKHQKKPAFPPGTELIHNQLIPLPSLQNSKRTFSTEVARMKKDIYSSDSYARNQYNIKLLQKRLQETPGPQWWQFDKQAATRSMSQLRQNLEQSP